MKKKYALLLFAFVLANGLAHGQAFTVAGTRILDPAGNEFIIKGVNVNGPHWPWPRPTIPDADLITNVWKFNTVRVNIVPSLANNGCCVNNNTNLDGIVNTYTGRKVVTMLENHDFTCRFPNATELAALKTWWVNLATRYKDNPYVWFNIMNEPGANDTDLARVEWRDTHEAVVKAIRDAGIQNIIVLDGVACGQEKGFKKGEGGSGILTYGPYLAQTYSNITFSLHLYSEWIYGRKLLGEYFDAVKAKNLSIHVGEYGCGDDYSGMVAADVIKVCNEKNIGRMVWQWAGGDSHQLTKGSGGFAIDRTDGTRPGNLTFGGNLIWKDNRNELTDADFAFPGPWLMNGTFEKEELEGWINFGGAAVETGGPNVKTGSRSMRINSGTESGAGQPLYLLADTTYVFSAWARHSAATTTASTVGVSIKGVGVADFTPTLSFTETAFTNKTVEFKTPAEPTESFLIVYKSNAGVAFYVDGIDLQLKSAVLGVEDGAGQQLMDVFPNPADTRLRVAPRRPMLIRQAWLLDMTGRRLPVSWTALENNAIELDMTGVPPGVYALGLQADRHVYHTRVVKR